MALCNSSDQTGCPQPALQSLENHSRFVAFWLIKKAMVFDQMSGERMVLATLHAALLLLPIADRALSAVYERRSSLTSQGKSIHAIPT
jgi:hypothetical protein